MTRGLAVLLAGVLVSLVAVAAACGGDSSGGLTALNGATAAPTPSASPSASVSASASPVESATTSPSASSSPTSAGGAGTTGDMSSDEFSAYLNDVKPWYDQIIATEADIIDVIALVEENSISPGQGGRRIERLGWKLDPPVEELAYLTPPAALDSAHHAWLDGISYEAQAFARISELMAKGTYQRGVVDSQYDALFRKASAKWTEWSDAVKGYETEFGVDAPWVWPDE
jgi:hypothetical protein